MSRRSRARDPRSLARAEGLVRCRRARSGRLAGAASRSGRRVLVACAFLAAWFGHPHALHAEGGIPSDAARVSFERFASDWFAQLGQAYAGSLDAGSPRSLGPGFEIELRATGDAREPYLGLLRYVEHVHTCSVSTTPKCRITQSLPVLEIFRHRDGRWIP